MALYNVTLQFTLWYMNLFAILALTITRQTTFFSSQHTIHIPKIILLILLSIAAHFPLTKLLNSHEKIRIMQSAFSSLPL